MPIISEELSSLMEKEGDRQEETDLDKKMARKEWYGIVLAIYFWTNL